MRTEDGCIIHKCLNGEPEAFGLLVDKYKAGIYAFAYAKLRDFRDAEDVTQEVFVQAYCDLRSLKRWESFVFWLYRIASTRCGKWIRARSRRPDTEFLEDQDPKTLEDSSIDSHRENQMNESLQEALYSLRETYREVLTLYYFGGMNSVDIAKALGTSPTAIRKRLSRARAQLKEEMTAMMGTAYEGQRLQASFTFRIVEAVKRIKIHPMPRATALPWGLSLAAGIIITVLSLNPHLNIPSDIAFPVSSPLSVEAKILKTGEIPVDILEIPQASIVSSMQGDGSSEAPELMNTQNALLLAPRDEEAPGVKFIAKDGGKEDWFGESVDISGDYAIVGAPGSDSKKSTAYIFKRHGTSWEQEAKLTAKDGAKEDWFGDSVAISDDYAVVAAPWDDDKGEDTGSVYFFKRDGATWEQQAKFTPHGEPISKCNFGWSIDISGDYVIVGSRQENWAKGAAYIFHYDGNSLVEEAKITAKDGARQDKFGSAVSIDGDYAIVGAPGPGDKDEGDWTGSAYIFKREGTSWKEQAKLTASDAAADDYFGYSVYISGDYAIVGAPRDDDKGSGSGSAYVFKREGTSWKEQAKLTASDGAVWDYFGGTVYISGDYAIVSATGDAPSSSIYVFLRSGTSWEEVKKQTASDWAAGNRDGFGCSISTSGDYAIIGAWGADAKGFNSGAAYIYHLRDLSLPPIKSVEPQGKLPTIWGGVKRTVLYQNYPNPFNPETWIPFRLSESKVLKIRIYTSAGQLIRTLDLGHIPPGSYLSKERAAYWDGRNEEGELVASDVYFYAMQAGESTDLRKMVMTR